MGNTVRNCYKFVILFFVIVSLGCTSDTEYTPPTKVESSSSGGEVAPEQTKTTSAAETQQEPKTTIFGIGETATDDELKVTVNNVRFVTKIDEKDNEFMVANAPSGKKYAIVEITVENVLSDKTQSVSTLLETMATDQDGYTYELDFEALTALDKQFSDGEVLPGMKKRGEVAYLVPTDATGLKFLYKFDLFSGTTAVFDISEAGSASTGTASESSVEEPKTTVFGVGDTATDDELKVTVNNVRFVNKIDEKDNQFMVAEAPSGKEYAVVDITVENVLSGETQSVSTMLETLVTDQDGYTYELDFEALTALDKQFSDGEILPGMKKRGDVAFLVPTDVTDLKFLYKFDLFTGTTAVFDIK